MTFREQPESDTRMCHSPEKSDRTLRPHAQDDFKIITEGRPQNDNLKCSQHPCRHYLQKSNTRTKDIKARQPTTKQDTSDCQTWDRSISPKGLAEFLTSGELERLRLGPEALGSLWSDDTSLDPPVTKASLGELDLVRIMNDPKLRHDLNFEREVAFRPNVYGSKGIQKIRHANEYWEALVVELAVYIVRCYRTSNPRAVLSGWLLRPALISNVRWRLPRLFETIRDILKTLVPATESTAVDQRLDVDLLMQELDHGTCDLVALSEWLGRLLLGSCSPLRDPSVTEMVSKIKQGVELNNARILVDGLKLLFGVLETMKLDVANHQIRYLRLIMVDDTVDFEQRYFLRTMSSNSPALDLRQACAWYDGVCDNGSLEELNGESRMTIFVKSIIELVVTTGESFPSTFMFNYDRIRILRSDFRSCVYQAICIQGFEYITRPEGRVALHSQSCDSLLKRIISVVGPDMSTHSWTRNASAVALEILREVYALRGIEGLPDETLLEQTEKSLRQYWDFGSAAYGEVEDHLYSRLEILVKQEIEAVEHLTPLQILNYVHPGPCDSNAEEDNEPLLSIARRIAHIGVIHWRVWAPILYEQQHANDLSRPAVGTIAANLSNSFVMSSTTSSGSLREDWPRDTAKEFEKADDTPEAFKQEGVELEDNFFENKPDQSELAAELNNCSISIPKT